MIKNYNKSLGVQQFEHDVFELVELQLQLIENLAVVVLVGLLDHLLPDVLGQRVAELLLQLGHGNRPRAVLA